MSGIDDRRIDLRASAARRFAAAQLGGPIDDFAAASADASFRRYFRVRCGAAQYIVMDAPPELENCESFVRIAGLLRDAGLRVPVIHAWARDDGYLLLEDFGRELYIDVLRPDNADTLFGDAISALILWQLASCEGVLPPYDEAVLRRELALFPDWYLGRHLERQPTADEWQLWERMQTLIMAQALSQPRVFVHRDFMPRNLMRCIPGPTPGVLDFQDALYGPLAYDLMSLFRDAFISWPQTRIDGWIALYHRLALAAGLPVPPQVGTLERDVDWIGVQRHLKVLGIFARIRYRDHKPRYLEDAPRFASYLAEAIERLPELAPLGELLRSWGVLHD